MINDPLYFVTTFAAGLVLGAFYLGALWLVLRGLRNARHPGLLILGSTACRIVLLLAAWYWVAGARWEGIVACLFGFLVMRFAATRLARSGLDHPATS